MPQRPSFNLRTRRWVEVRWSDPTNGSQPKVGLEELLVRSHEIEAIMLAPAPALSALYRVLYALTARVTGLDEAHDGEDDWYDRRTQVLEKHLDADRIGDYFDPLPGRFDLFSPDTPFLQDPRLADPAVCPKKAGVNKLVLGRPAGNNSVWFSHHWDGSPVPVSSADAFVNLLVWLYYGPSGRCASRTHGEVTAADVSAGPLRGSLSYHPEGATLLETLLAGLVPPPEHLDKSDDPCPWELPALPEPLALPKNGAAPYPGPCSRLTGGWQHAILLIPDTTGEQVIDACITWGRRHKQPATDDAYVIHQVSKQGNIYARPAEAGRALWRDLDALLDLKTTAGPAPRRPQVFDHTDELGTFRIRSLGFDQDGKTKDVQFVSGCTPQPIQQIKQNDLRTARCVGDLRSAGVLYGRRLEYAVKLAWATVVGKKVGPCAWFDEAVARYWPLAEDLFWARMRNQDFENARRRFLRLAATTFDEVTSSGVRDTRSARAVELARFELYGGRRKSGTRTIPTSTPTAGPSMTDKSSPQKTPYDKAVEFVTEVYRLCEDPGKRAALRSGLGRPVDQSPRMHRVIVGRVPARWEVQRAYYAIASMISWLPPQTRELPKLDKQRDFGACLAQAIANGVLRESSAEDKLDLLSRQNEQGLHRHLPAAVRMLADRPDAVDWAQLLLDLRRWDENRDAITRRWLQSFYRLRFQAEIAAAAAADESD